MPKAGASGAEYYDINYGLASASITAGLNVVATTQCSYHGITIIASATRTVVYVYDNASATSGNLIDLIVIATTAGLIADKFIPIYAKKGIVIGITGTGAIGTVFYGPKG